MEQSGGPASPSLRAPRKALDSLLARLRRALAGFRRVGADHYRPERHYMRGPGPKARARAPGAGPPAHR